MKSILQTFYVMLLTGVLIGLAACNHHNNNKEMKTENSTTLFPKGDKLTNGYFSGEAYLQPLLAKDKNNDFVLGSVTFEPGARTNWHKHPKGQVLIVTEGEGLNQEKGKPVQIIRKGDIINVPENVEHWHGASANSKMVHIAITNYLGDTNAIWLNPVTSEEYNEANKKIIHHAPK